MLLRLFILLGTFSAAFAAVWPLLPSFVPRFGAHHFYRLQRRRNALAAAGILTTIASARRTGRRLPAVLSLVFGALSQILRPERMFVSVDAPVTVPAEKASLSGEELVIGMEVDGEARAWPLHEMVVPHHLVNDRIGDTPLLVAY